MNPIKSLIIKGAFFTGVSKYSVQLINLLVTAILARLLPPADFGIVALTVVIISFFDILANAGMGPAIIQNKHIGHRDIIQIFRFSIVLALIFSILFILSIHPISSFYGEHRLINVLYLISIQLFFNTLNVVPTALLLKNKKFKYIAKITSLSAFFCGLISIIFAYVGIGIYSLLITPICNSIISFLMFSRETVFRYNINAHKWDFEPVKKILTFSIFQFSFNIVNYLSRNLDKILLGRYIGMVLLGYYEKSYRLMTLPISTLTSVFSPTLQPVLSDYQDNKAIIRNVYNRLCEYLFLLGCLIAPFMFFCAYEIIIIIFGENWIEAVPIFQVLSISIPFQLVDSLSGGILQSTGSIKSLFVSGLICAVVNVMFLIIALIIFSNIVYIALMISIGLIFNFFISTVFINKYSINQSYFKYLNVIYKYAVPAIIISIILYLGTYLNLNGSLYIIFSLIVTMCIGVCSLYCFKLMSGLKVN